MTLLVIDLKISLNVFNWYGNLVDMRLIKDFTCKQKKVIIYLYVKVFSVLQTPSTAEV